MTTDSPRRGGVLVLGLAGFLIATVITIVVALAIFVVTYLFVARPYQMNGRSMEPAYSNDQYIIGNVLAYKYGRPERGDVVIFSSPQNADVDFIQRVVGLPRERVKISGGKGLINGTILD